MDGIYVSYVSAKGFEKNRPFSGKGLPMRGLLPRLRGMSCLPRMFLLLVFALLANSEEAIASVSIREIDFNRVDSNASSGDWFECAIEIEVRRDALDPNRRRPDYLDDLKVELLLGVESSVSGQKGFEFFKAEAFLVSLKEGQHLVRFYLPPEVVERDRIRNDVHSFLIRLSRSGKMVEEQVSRHLARTNVRDSFLKRVELEASRNDGILLPQFKTPFDNAYPRDTPSYRNFDNPAGK